MITVKDSVLEQEIENEKTAEYDKWRQEVLFRSAGHTKSKTAAIVRTELPPFSFRTVVDQDPAVAHTNNEILEDAMLPKTADEVIAEREKTHGYFRFNAAVGQTIREAIRNAPGWVHMTPEQREALDHIAGKIARVVSNGGRNPDDYLDIAGYARLGEIATRQREDCV